MKRSDFRTAHKTLKSGPRIYYYAISTGKRFWSSAALIEAPYPKDFTDAFDAVDNPTGDCAALIDAYLESPKFLSLASKTRADYSRCLSAARKRFGSTSIDRIESREFRGEIIDWQEEIGATAPRSADMHVSSFSIALGYAHRKGKILHNPAANTEALYQKSEAKEPWSQDDINNFLSDCPRKAEDAFRLGMLTGLRVSDLAAIRWSSWQEDYLIVRTSKGQGNRTAVIPITLEGRTFLTELKNRQLRSSHGLQPYMLTKEDGRPCKPRVVSALINDRAKVLGIAATAHQLRNTYATVLVEAGIPEEEIAGVMGWSVAQVKELIRIYVKPHAIAAAHIKRLSKSG